MTELSYPELREQLVKAAHILFQSGVMSHSGHGNMSVRLPESGQMLLTSVGQITHLTPEQQAVVTFDGAVKESFDTTAICIGRTKHDSWPLAKVTGKPHCGTIPLFQRLLRKKDKKIVTVRRVRIYDAIALFTVLVVILLDQWTKSLVVAHMGLPGSRNITPLIGPYLVIDYIQNRGAAFGVFANNAVLVVLIAAAICVVAYLYIRMLNTGSLFYKIVFGMIIGGALGNLLDRAHNGGVVTDFISFRIPEINYYFAVFNVADACISVGVVLLFMLVLFGGLRHDKNESTSPTEPTTSSTTSSGTLRPTEQDAQH